MRHGVSIPECEVFSFGILIRLGSNVLLLQGFSYRCEALWGMKRLEMEILTSHSRSHIFCCISRYAGDFICPNEMNISRSRAAFRIPCLGWLPGCLIPDLSPSANSDFLTEFEMNIFR